MVSLLEDNSLGDTSLNPYLHILNNGEGIGQGRISDDIGNVTIEHVDVSKIAPDEFVLDKNIFTQDQDQLEIGIQAGDVNSLLKQFEESEASQAGNDNKVTSVPPVILESSVTKNLSKMNADGNLRKSVMTIEAIAKKIVPVKRKSTILLENVTLPMKRNRKPANHVAFRTTSSQPRSQPSSLPCSHPNSLPNSAPNSLPASQPSSCSSSRSCSPVHQWTAPLMDHDYCYIPKVYLPMNGIDPSSPMCVNKENGEISDASTPEKKEEEKRNELYMGKYKIKKRNHRHRHHHHHHHHHHCRHHHQDGSQAILEAGLMSNPNSPTPALIDNVQGELDNMYQKAREEFQKRFGKLEVPIIPEKKTLKIQSLNEPPLTKLRKKVDNSNQKPASTNCNVKKESQPDVVSCGKKKEIDQTEEPRSSPLVIRKPEVKKETTPPANNVSDQEQLMHATSEKEQEKLIPATNATDQEESIDEVNEARCSPVIFNLEEERVDKTKEICPKEDISKVPESPCDQPEDNVTCEQKLQAPAATPDKIDIKPVEFTENIDKRDGLYLEKNVMDIDVTEHDKVIQLKEEISSLIKDGQNRDDGGVDYSAKTEEPPVITDEEDSGEIESSDECADRRKDDEDRQSWREGSYSPYRRGRSSARSSQWSVSRSRSQSFTKCRSRSRSYERSRLYERSRSRSRSKSYMSQRRWHHRRRRRYRRSSHSSCSISSRSSSRGSRRGRSRSSSCSTYPSRSCSRSKSRSFSRSHSRTRSRQSRCRSRSSSSRRRSRRHRSSDRRRRYLRDRSVSRERRLEMKKREEQEWEDRRVLYVGNISEGTTRRDISYRFRKFGDITRITLHFRDKGDNYCFVTFAYTCDAYAAVEFGNEDPSFPKYDICFGGRRSFCRTSYADLDNMHKEEDELKYGYNGPAAPTRTRSASKETDFDALLKQALKKVKHR